MKKKSNALFVIRKFKKAKILYIFEKTIILSINWDI